MVLQPKVLCQAMPKTDAFRQSAERQAAPARVSTENYLGLTLLRPQEVIKMRQLQPEVVVNTVPCKTFGQKAPAENTAVEWPCPHTKPKEPCFTHEDCLKHRRRIVFSPSSK